MTRTRINVFQKGPLRYEVRSLAPKSHRQGLSPDEIVDLLAAAPPGATIKFFDSRTRRQKGLGGPPQDLAARLAAKRIQLGRERAR